MKINVKDIDSNPFRNIEQYPIDRAKVEALKTSIETTSFWDNIIARKKNGRYQIAYGHHRLIAIKELRIKQVDIPVRKLDDATMLRIMAEENLDWSTTPAVINETVLAVKTYLDYEFAKYDKTKDLPKLLLNLVAEKKQSSLAAAKRGVGQNIILKFLGGNWKKWQIEQALDTLRDDTLDREAVEKLPTLYHARTFKQAVRDYRIPKAKQKRIAAKIARQKDKIGAVEISAAVRRESASATELDKDEVFIRMEKLVADIDRQSRALKNKIMVLRRDMEELNVKQLKGVKVTLAKSSLKQLYEEMERLNRKGQ